VPHREGYDAGLLLRFFDPEGLPGDSPTQRKCFHGSVRSREGYLWSGAGRYDDEAGPRRRTMYPLPLMGARPAPADWLLGVKTIRITIH
jgi:hypothetical protein